MKGWAEIKAAQRTRLRGLGLVEKHVWVHPLDWPALKKLAAKLRTKRVPNEIPTRRSTTDRP